MSRPSAPPSFYSSVLQQMTEGASRATLSLLAIRNPPLRHWLQQAMERTAGSDGAYVAAPVFEATFGWRRGEKSLGELAGNLLDGALVKALAHPHRQAGGDDDYRLAPTLRPYHHQIAAWQALLTQQPPQSLLVSSGTGSGKSECFLIPLLSELARQSQQSSSLLVGVQAILLYPLNALIKSQQDRLLAWIQPLGDKIRFALYNGNLPEEGKSSTPCQVADRATLRKSPPPILVTNPTMLEYMLVRQEDAPILRQSQGKLRWIIIDEAHSYIGSQAAELTLQLRRVVHAFGVSADDLHIIATSATLGDNNDDTRQQLRQFLADLAGVSQDRVTVIFGEREVPPLPPVTTAAPLASLHELETLPQGDRYAACCNDPRLRQLRAALARAPMRLDAIARQLAEGEGASELQTALSWLDGVSQVADKEGTPFLPLRGHLFQRSLNGLWACANRDCTGRHGTPLEEALWPHGAVFDHMQQQCRHCGMPVYPIVLCDHCGQVALQGYEDLQQRLIALPLTPPQDEFRLFDIEEDETCGSDDDGQAEATRQTHGSDIAAANVYFPRLLVEAGVGESHRVGLNSDRQLDLPGRNGVGVHLYHAINDSNTANTCPLCHGRSNAPPRSQLIPLRIGAPFILFNLLPPLLAAMPPLDRGEDKPLKGRRLITFSDSRQGTARLAVGLQQWRERDHVRSLLLHTLAGRQQQVAPNAASRLLFLQEQIDELDKLVAQGNIVIKPTLVAYREEQSRLKSPPIGKLSWEEAIGALQHDNDFSRWVVRDMQELSSSMGLRATAQLALYREFLIRPRRNFSLEGLGLIKLHFPRLEGCQPPKFLVRRDWSAAMWQDLLHMVIDHWIRSGPSAVYVEGGIDTLRWLGFRVKPRHLFAPESPRKGASIFRWPEVNKPRSHLIFWLARVVGCNASESPELLADLLHEIWQALQGVMHSSNDGYQLDLAHAELHQVTTAWFCPVTRRMLPRAVKGITPYLVEGIATANLVECQSYPLPCVPDPFWLRSGESGAHQWLASDPQVVQLRRLGLWNNLHDRFVSYAHYLRAREHSAQIASHDLTQRESDFKQGNLNLLSCSTTMEMGVDIGGLSAVAMSNVPPHPANYLQRSGRAGRRNEKSALSYTLCRNTPHNQAVFANPLWPFTTPMTPPRIALDSRRIAQRHVNALLLATYFHHGCHNVTTSSCDNFFHTSDTPSSLSDRFVAWCRQPISTDLADAINTLLQGTPCHRQAVVTAAADHISTISRDWRATLATLEQQKMALGNGNKAAVKALEQQIKRWKNSYLLGELADRGFLPGYGFPTDLVPFIPTTGEMINQRGQREEREREDNRARRLGYPTRNLPLAIRDYAPGSDVVIDGRVYRSAGVTLNWQIPASEREVREVQSLRWLWHCQACGAAGVEQIMPTHCPSCASDDGNLQRHEMLQPAGFTVDIRYNTHNDISTPRYIRPQEPLIHLADAPWQPLPLPWRGRLRAATNGDIIHHSSGENGKGYALCLHCGRADSMTAEGGLPSSFLRDDNRQLSHLRLRGGKSEHHESHCSGNDSAFAIKRHLWLGYKDQSDIGEIQFVRDDEPVSHVIAYTLGIAMQLTLAELLGINAEEIGVTIREQRDADGKRTPSIYLYDTHDGGSGYASQLPHLIGQILPRLASRLDCTAHCDTVCHRCLLNHISQHHVDMIDRPGAQNWLAQFMKNGFARDIRTDETDSQELSSIRGILSDI
jgi:DEAD/DEAH box helicase domain-containing protein